MIKEIIREEIEKYILSEAVNVTPLSNHIQPLNNYFNEIKRINGGNNPNVDRYLNDLNSYILQIISAIKRCVNSNSLNEGLRDYGFEYPQELGGNLWYDMKNSYYNTKNFINRFRNKGNNNSYANARSGGNNTFKQEKLSILLNKLQTYKLNYSSLQNEIDNLSQAPHYALYEIEQLQNEYTSLVQQNNAQGTNP